MLNSLIFFEAYNFLMTEILRSNTANFQTWISHFRRFIYCFVLLIIFTTGETFAPLPASGDYVNNVQKSDGLLIVPYTFVFDPLSPNFHYVGKIKSVAIVGSFNQNNPDTMLGPNGDSLWKKTISFQAGVPVEYQFILNGALPVNDPDNPLVSINNKSVTVPQVNPLPFFSNFSPKQGTLFEPPVSSLKIQAKISPGDSGYAIDKNSLHVFVDGLEVDFTADPVEKGFLITHIENDLSIGRHIVAFTGADVRQQRAKTAYLTFGVYPARSGYHYIDAEKDDDGPGGYTYPLNTTPNACDLRSVHITTNNIKDSLLFTVDLAKITDFTRVALEITNNLAGNTVDALLPQSGIHLKVPDWNRRGIYLILAVPNSSTINDKENVLFISRDPLQKGDSVYLNTDARTTGQFRFALSLASLEQVLGTYYTEWYFSAYTFLRDIHGIVDPDSMHQAPAVYDVAFMPDFDTQHRLLRNYRSALDFGGPRLAVIASNGRGVRAIRPEEIDASFTNRVFVKILADGGELFKDRVTIYGSVSDSTITTAKIHVISGNTSFDTTTSVGRGVFAQEIHLDEGENKISATVTKDSIITRSREVIYKRIVDHKLQITTSTSVNGTIVTLTANAISPDGAAISSYTWVPDANNPSPVTLITPLEASTLFNAPEIVGEYYFTVTATSSKDTSSARVVIVIDSVSQDLVRPKTVDLSTWHPKWIDTAIVYEVFPKTLSLAGTLKAVTGRLPILKDLGVTCLLLMPVHPSASADGYRITDFYNVNPDYGTKDDLKQLIQRAHQYGMKVIIDYVVEHTHNTHPFMVDAFQYQQRSPYYDFYLWNPDGSYRYLFNWIDAPSINFESGDTRDYLMRVAKYWLIEFNLDGFRCDLAGKIDDSRLSGSSFWRRFRTEIKRIKPDILLIGDADINNGNYFDGKFDAGYDLGVLTELKNVFNGVTSIASLDSAIAFYSQPEYLQYALPLRFLERHDEARFIMRYSLAQTKVAAALLLTLPGLPMLYAGQEVGEQTSSNIIDWNDSYNLRNYYRKLIQTRLRNRALANGDFKRIANTAPDSVYSFLRTKGNDKIIVNHNLRNVTVTIKMKISGADLGLLPNRNYYLSDILNNMSYLVTDATISQLPLTLQSYTSQILVVSAEPIVAVKEENHQPLKYELSQNYPNPFNLRTVITYQVPDASHVKLEVYNVLGQKVVTLVDETQPAGQYLAEWDGKNSLGQQVASGVYFYWLSATGINGQGREFSDVKKMVLVK